MSIEAVRTYLEQWGRAGDIIELETSTATVAQAAGTLGVIPARIAKSISLKMPQGASPETTQNSSGSIDSAGSAMLVITAGDMKIDNRKFKDRFGFKVKMLSPGEALALTGHAVGGVCPFALPQGTAVYLDVSLQRFTTVFPACGSSNSAIELSLPELEEYSRSRAWVDVCA